jgi:hypothetical protein
MKESIRYSIKLITREVTREENSRDTNELNSLTCFSMPTDPEKGLQGD